MSLFIIEQSMQTCKRYVPISEKLMVINNVEKDRIVMEKTEKSRMSDININNDYLNDVNYNGKESPGRIRRGLRNFKSF